MVPGSVSVNICVQYIVHVRETTYSSAESIVKDLHSIFHVGVELVLSIRMLRLLRERRWSRGYLGLAAFVLNAVCTSNIG